MATRESFRSQLYFNKGNRKYHAIVNYLQSKRKSLLTSGFEERENSRWKIEQKINISKKIYLRLESSHSIQGVRSDFLESRNYTI